MAQSARFHCAGATLPALLPRYCCIHEFCVALLLLFYCASIPPRFRCVNFEVGKNKRRDRAIMLLHSRFYYDLEASSALLQLLS